MGGGRTFSLRQTRLDDVGGCRVHSGSLLFVRWKVGWWLPAKPESSGPLSRCLIHSEIEGWWRLWGDSVRRGEDTSCLPPLLLRADAGGVAALGAAASLLHLRFVHSYPRERLWSKVYTNVSGVTPLVTESFALQRVLLFMDAFLF